MNKILSLSNRELRLIYSYNKLRRRIGCPIPDDDVLSIAMEFRALNERARLANEILPYVGNLFSPEFFQRNILRS